MSHPAPLSSAERRAISYANTLHQLVSHIFDKREGADRVLANYFREHKKHGSKDRKLIRETLFGLFRWWGWLKNLPAADGVHVSGLGFSSGLGGVQSQHWFTQLSLVAAIENHPWQDIRGGWLTQSGLTQLDIPAFGDTPESLNAICAALKSQFAGGEFTPSNLVPDWAWEHIIVPEAEKLAFIDALCRRPPLWTRAQGETRDQVLKQLQADEIAAIPSDRFDDAIELASQSINLDGITAYKSGKLEVQDLASQAIGEVAAPKAGERWWDACAGAGGKSLQLFSLMQKRGGVGELVASDIRPKALEELLRRADKAGFSPIQISPWRSDKLPVKADYFDGVLVDAPCSCTGTWRRNPDMRWIDDAAAIMDKPALQLDILRRASAAVRSGGVLIYATCSLARAENDAVAEDFLAAHPDFEPDAVRHPFSGEHSAAAKSAMLTLWPQQANADGMFVARFKRR
ncbi:RsmB/NOP family class I SAM-dependent RNA methyltransferase [Shewanella litorisediminis]|uniref:RsmB/NOP family class I SAM-dependent RNA methyltransferase n=1 Tax=Shewanella litorisediminis TaxID=1173586 RepID=A0ABX7G6K9_9GAMM|nr:RsmB/NOP family class I SAM-dependent RNA methyltransferase [Shewanella litorisediminis]MCL2917705.1 RsmB/NOP family class I SAM-dependent RNA methyltransferase [Shewanella litorisediminis]QRH02825.1 RsmB/NOP family class I SAM-dependent RNA methyltransferase [Shewanella litorisediminis]